MQSNVNVRCKNKMAALHRLSTAQNRTEQTCLVCELSIFPVFCYHVTQNSHMTVRLPYQEEIDAAA